MGDGAVSLLPDSRQHTFIRDRMAELTKRIDTATPGRETRAGEERRG